MNLKTLKILLFSCLSCFEFMGDPRFDGNGYFHFDFTDPMLEMLNERLENLPQKEMTCSFNQDLFEYLIFEINDKSWYALED